MARRSEAIRRSGRVVEGDGLENRSAKAPGVRIPPPPPSEAEIRRGAAPVGAPARAARAVARHDAKLPSATACIAGGPIRGSWWGHAKGKLIYETLTRIDRHGRLGEAGAGKRHAGPPAAVAGAGRRRRIAARPGRLRGLQAGRQAAAAADPARPPRAHRRSAAPAKGRKLARRRDGAGAPAARAQLQRAHRRRATTRGSWKRGRRGAGRAASRRATSPARRRPSKPCPRPVLAWTDGPAAARGCCPGTSRLSGRDACSRGPVSTIVGRAFWRGGREAEGGGLLNRYTAQKLYRGFESLPLRNFLST